MFPERLETEENQGREVRRIGLMRELLIFVRKGRERRLEQRTEQIVELQKRKKEVCKGRGSNGLMKRIWMG